MRNYLGNLFANLKNGQLTRRSFIYHHKKKSCESFLKILWNEGFLIGYKNSLNHPKKLKIFLKYKKGRPVINSIKLVSWPGRRIYYSTNQIWKINSSKTFIVFSTNQGLKSIKECRKYNLGGEPFIVIARYKKYLHLFT